MGRELNLAKAKLREVVAHRIKVQRLKAKFTQEEMAKKINTNFLTYRGYENCKSDIPLALLVRIADVFDVSLDYLVGREEESEPKPKEKASDDYDAIQQRLAQLEKQFETIQNTLENR